MKEAPRPAVKLHRGTCFHCGATGEMPAEHYTCCWNPTGCECVAEVARHLDEAQTRGRRS